uniref:Uncharacterized protein n=1 Tax=Arundo donax TaxID=35708 RepID=A0A0A8XSR5_ARUDO
MWQIILYAFTMPLSRFVCPLSVTFVVPPNLSNGCLIVSSANLYFTSPQFANIISRPLCHALGSYTTFA